MNMMKCKIFEATSEYSPAVGGTITSSVERNFNNWSETTNYEIEDIRTHSDMNDVVKSIVVFYEEPEDDESKVV